MVEGSSFRVLGFKVEVDVDVDVDEFMGCLSPPSLILLLLINVIAIKHQWKVK